MSPTDFLLVDRPDQLRPALAALADARVVGVDVERADAHRYFRAAALVQVGCPAGTVLVDPLAVPDLAGLHRFLAGRTTVLHALENDLGPMASLGVTPAGVEDTAIAAAMLGLPTGLEGLLRSLLGVDLGGDKQAMQRADWEARPLAPEMLAYAAADVVHLPALWEVLAQRLDAAGRRGWYGQELAAALAQPPAGERRTWARTRGAGRLNPAARARLRALWDTREELARRTDTAPARIVGDKVLVELATTPPTSTAQLGRRGVRRQAVRAYGTQLMAAIAAGDAADDEPRRRSGRAPTDAERALADRLRALRADRARALGLDPGVLCPSRTLLAAVLSEPGSPEALRDALGLRPWQWEQLGRAFCEELGLHGPGKPPPETDTVASQ